MLEERGNFDFYKAAICASSSLARSRHLGQPNIVENLLCTGHHAKFWWVGNEQAVAFAF